MYMTDSSEALALHVIGLQTVAKFDSFVSTKLLDHVKEITLDKDNNDTLN